MLMILKANDKLNAKMSKTHTKKGKKIENLCWLAGTNPSC